MSEPLYTCPRCGRAGYTARGLRAHVCRACAGTRHKLSKSEVEEAIASQDKAEGRTL